jgi:hypothetical protein
MLYVFLIIPILFKKEVNVLRIKIKFIFLLLLLFSNYSIYGQDNHHNDHESHQKIENNYAKIKIININKVKDKFHVLFSINKVLNNEPVTLNELKLVHTQKIHLLIIDSSLEDYSHIHPRSTVKSGVYEFEWTPKYNSSYKMWADIVPIETNKQEYDIVKLIKNKDTKIDKKEILESKMDNLSFKLSFSSKSIIKNTPVMGKITIQDGNGNLVKNLQPIMGAYAHIVAFNENFSDIEHIHPMGLEPKDSAELGGPEINFHLNAKQAGFIKIFAQVLINDKEYFIPFGVTVNE